MKRMLCVYVFLVWVLLGAASANAQQNDSKRVAAMRYHENRLKRVAYYITTHKELLISDTLVVFAWSADAASSVHCQRIPGCDESNPSLGRHPNEFHTWGLAMGYSAALITLTHLSQHFAPDHFDRHLYWSQKLVFSSAKLGTCIPMPTLLSSSRIRPPPAGVSRHSL
jgi:hypothetical protein